VPNLTHFRVFSADIEVYKSFAPPKECYNSANSKPVAADPETSFFGGLLEENKFVTLTF
jgi:hypothetical protein